MKAPKIAHGTPAGASTHHRYNIPFRDDCGCKEAQRIQQQEYRNRTGNVSSRISQQISREAQRRLVARHKSEYLSLRNEVREELEGGRPQS